MHSEIYPLKLTSGTIIMRNSSISSSVSHLKLDGSRGCNVAHPYKLLASRHYVVIAFAGVVVSHAKGVASRVLVADHCHPSPDALLDEQILINIIEKIQFHVRILKSSLPGQIRGSVIMSRMKKITLEVHVSTILEHIGK